MLVKVRIAPDSIEVADRGVLLLWPVALFVVGAFTYELTTRWRDTPMAEASWTTWILTLAFVGSMIYALPQLIRMRRLRCRFDATTRRAEFERFGLRSVDRRSVAFADIAEVVVRERTGDEGGLMRGVHVLTRSGERIDVTAVDVTDWNRFAKLGDAIREMIGRPGGASPRPVSPRA